MCVRLVLWSGCVCDAVRQCVDWTRPVQMDTHTHTHTHKHTHTHMQKTLLCAWSDANPQIGTDQLGNRAHNRDNHRLYPTKVSQTRFVTCCIHSSGSACVCGDTTHSSPCRARCESTDPRCVCQQLRSPVQTSSETFADTNIQIFANIINRTRARFVRKSEGCQQVHRAVDCHFLLH